MAAHRTCVIGVTLAVFFVAATARAQELEPRSYRPLPKGLNFLLVSYSYSKGNILTEPTAPIENLDVSTQTVIVGYGRSLGLFGRGALFTVAVPHAYLTGSATLGGEEVRGERNGFGDARLKLAVNVLGGPAMTPAEFARRRPRHALGLSLAVAVPVGQYDENLLVNIGTNRWGAKLETGYSITAGRWTFDVAAGVWFFTANDEFLVDSTLRQQPIGSLQAHVSYQFRGGVWLALDTNYFGGGRTSVDGEERDDLQRNSRLGMTLSVPLRGGHSLRVSGHTGAFTRIGADFDVGAIAYQYRWPNPRRRAPPAQVVPPGSSALGH